MSPEIWNHIVNYGWLVSLILWGVLIYWKFRPSSSLREVAEQLFWVVEQVDELSGGAVKGDAKWAIYRAILLVVGKVLFKLTDDELESVGKKTVSDLKESAKKPPKEK